MKISFDTTICWIFLIPSLRLCLKWTDFIMLMKLLCSILMGIGLDKAIQSGNFGKYVCLCFAMIFNIFLLLMNKTIF